MTGLSPAPALAADPAPDRDRSEPPTTVTAATETIAHTAAVDLTTIITGLVTDAVTGAPLANITVSASVTDVNGDPQQISTGTDDDGTFTIDVTGIDAGPNPFSIGFSDPIDNYYPNVGNRAWMQPGYDFPIAVALIPKNQPGTSDLSTGLSVQPPTFYADADNGFWAQYFNAGPAVAEDVTLAVEIPEGMQLTGAVAPPGYFCNVQLRQAYCTAAEMPPGPVTIEFRFTAPEAGSFPSGISTALTAATPDPYLDNNQFTWTPAVIEPVTGGLFVDSFFATPVVGRVREAYVRAYNVGPSSVRDVVFEAELPAGLEYSEVTVYAPAGAECDPTPTGYHCTAEVLGPNEQISISFMVTAAVEGTYEGVLTATTSTPQIDTDDDTAQVIVTVYPQGAADLFTWIFTSTQVAANALVTIPIQFYNQGPDDATDVTVTFQIPDGFTIDGPDGVPGAPWTCTITEPTVTCTRPFIPSGEFAEMPLRLHTPEPGRSGQLVVSSSHAGTDPTPGDFAVTLTTVLDEVDLSGWITPTQIDVGRTTTLTVGVSNGSQRAAFDASVTVTIPDGLGFDPSAPFAHPPSCSYVAPHLTCPTPVGGFGTNSFPIVVHPPDAGEFVVVADVASSSPDPNPSDNHVEATITVVAPIVDVSVTTPAGEPTLGSSRWIWTEIRNEGTGRASFEIDLETSPNLRIDAAYPFGLGNGCATTATTVNCTVNNLPSGFTGYLQLAVTGLEPGPASMTVDVPPLTGEIDLADNTATGSFTLHAPEADLIAALSDVGAAPLAGVQTTRTISVTSLGPTEAPNARLQLSVAGAAIDAVTGPLGSCPVAATSATCELGPLPPGYAYGVTVTFTPHTAGETVRIDWLATSDAIDPNTADNIGTWERLIEPSDTADLSVYMSPGWTTIAVGDVTQIEVHVGNNGPGSPTGATLTIETPPHVVVTPIGLPDGTVCTDVTCTLDTIPVFGSATITLAVLAVSQGFGELRVSIAGPGADPWPYDNNAAGSIYVAPDESQLFGWMIGPATIVPANPTPVDVTISAGSPGPARDVVAEFGYPDNLTVGGWPAEWNCTERETGATCSIGRLTASTGAQLWVEAIEPAPMQVITLDLTSANDPNPFDNRAEYVVDVVAPGTADLSVDVASPGTLVLGHTSTVTVTVANLGPAPSVDATVTIDVPAIVAPGELPPGCAYETPTVTCTLPAAMVYPVVVSLVVVPTGAVGDGVVTASVGHPGSDPAPWNDTRSVQITVVPDQAALSVLAPPALDLAIDAVHHLQYTVVNSGPAPARGVTITIDLPANLTIVGWFGSGGSCQTDASQFVCSVTTIPAGWNWWVSLVVSAGELGEGTATVTATADNAGAVAAEHAITVVPSDAADVRITSVAHPSELGIGELVTLSATIDSTGPGTATGVEASIALPAGFEVTSLSAWFPATCAHDPVAKVIDCALGVGWWSSVTITVQGRLDTVGSAAFTASVRATSPDVRLANNTSTSSVEVFGPPSAPLDVSATPRDSSIVVAWLAPTDSGGAPIERYVVEVSADGATSWTVAGVAGGDQLSTAIAATNDSEHLVRVTAITRFGSSEPSEPAGPVVPRPAPDAPTDVRARAGNSAVDLDWRAPRQPRGLPAITDYLIEYTVDGGATWTLADDPLSTRTSATVTGLTNGVTYRFRITAVNDYGNSPSTESPDAIPRPRRR